MQQLFLCTLPHALSSQACLVAALSLALGLTDRPDASGRGGRASSSAELRLGTTGAAKRAHTAVSDTAT